ncbi:MAG: hypothetical protein GDA67_04665 [Nitrospira sp. CR1.3]|nr:hypothetical protein [Nitrospira sp. CR1.3]
MDENAPSCRYDGNWSRRGLLQRLGLIGLGVLEIPTGHVAANLTAAHAGFSWTGHSPAQPSALPVGNTGQPGRASTSELLTILQGQPGGPQVIDRAKKGGAQVLLNPNLVPPFSVSLAIGRQQVGGHWLELYDVGVKANTLVTLHGPPLLSMPCLGENQDSPAFKYQRSSRVRFQIQFPKKGWYLISLEGFVDPVVTPFGSITSVTGQLIPVGAFNGPPIQQWTYPVARQARWFPALYEHAGSVNPLEFYLPNPGGLLFRELKAEAL